MRKSKVLAKLRNGEAVLCLKNTFASPDIVEMMGYLGLDVVWICNEHIAINPENMRNIVRAGRAADIDVMVRRAYGHYDDLMQLLEMGAAGLMIPHCTDHLMAAKLVRDLKFHPLGKRGVDGVSGDSFYGTSGGETYMAHANAETFLMVQIEDAEAIDRIEEIAETPGVDILFIGPADLSHSLGVPGELKHPAVTAAIDRAIKACARNGKFCGTPGLDEAYTKSLLDKGVRFITGGGDFGILRQGFSRLKDQFERMSAACNG